MSMNEFDTQLLVEHVDCRRDEFLYGSYPGSFPHVSRRN